MAQLSTKKLSAQNLWNNIISCEEESKKNPVGVPFSIALI